MDIPQPEPGHGEVLVMVGAAGVCHSNLHIIEALSDRFLHALNRITPS
jgi:propanol-preferring alcohol dehydrogenase